MFFVYMIKNDFEKLYVGATDNSKNRVRDHNSGRGAIFTKGKAKFNIVFLEEYQTFIEARKREIQIKKWRRSKKEVLIKRYQKGLPTKLKRPPISTDFSRKREQENRHKISVDFLIDD